MNVPNLPLLEEKIKALRDVLRGYEAPLNWFYEPKDILSVSVDSFTKLITFQFKILVLKDIISTSIGHNICNFGIWGFFGYISGFSIFKSV